MYCFHGYYWKDFVHARNLSASITYSISSIIKVWFLRIIHSVSEVMWIILERYTSYMAGSWAASIICLVFIFICFSDGWRGRVMLLISLFVYISIRYGSLLYLFGFFQDLEFMVNLSRLDESKLHFAFFFSL